MWSQNPLKATRKFLPGFFNLTILEIAGSMSTSNVKSEQFLLVLIYSEGFFQHHRNCGKDDREQHPEVG